MLKSQEKVPYKAFIQLVEQHLGDVYNFAYRVSNDVRLAQEQAHEVFLRAYLGRDKLPADDQVGTWLLKIGVHVALGKVDGGQRITFEYLDDVIRGDPTQVTRTEALSDPERQLLLWELKQCCLTSVLNCLSLGERMAFVMVVMMATRPALAAASLGITPAALKVRLSRAKKKIVDYVAPRCEHVHPMNPCRCPSRLGVALQKGFIRDLGPDAAQRLRRLPPEALEPAAPVLDVVALYEQLPGAGDLEELHRHIVDELCAGAWDAK